MLVWPLRVVLVAGLVLLTTLWAVLSTALADHPAYPDTVEDPGALTRPAVLLVADGVGCSATLAGPAVALTAGHCVLDPTGVLREPIRAYVTARGYDVERGVADAAYTCRVDGVRVPGLPVGADDWAVLRLGSCRDGDRHRTDRVGDVVGYHSPAAFDETQRRAGTTRYIGYPTTPEGRFGVLQRLEVGYDYRPLLLSALRPHIEEQFTCAHAAVVPAGGSGGGLVTGTRDGLRLVGVNNFLLAGSHACFRKVDDEILAAIEAAGR